MKAAALLRIVCIALFLTLLSGGPASGAMPIPLAFSASGFATSTTDSEYHAEIAGDLVAWTTQFAGPGAHTAIAWRNLATGSADTIGGGDASNEQYPDVSLGRIAYQTDVAGSWDVRVRDLWFPRDYSVASNASDNEVEPRIDGNLIVWRNNASGWLWFKDLYRDHAAEPVPGATSVVSYDVDNGRIVWSDDQPTSANVRYWRPDGLGSATIFTVTGADFSIDWVRVHGDKVVFAVSTSTDSRTYLYDLPSDVLTNIPTHVDPYDDYEPVVFNSGFAWVQWPTGNGNIYFRYLPPLIGAKEVAISNQNEHAPSMWGRRIVYSREEWHSTDLWMGIRSWKDAVRTAGANRYATAVEASRLYFSKAKHAVICTGEGFPDALAAVPLARAVNGPLLLTRKDSLPPETLTELSRLGVRDISLIGGTPTISAAVQAQLTAAGYTVTRIAGADRYETSAKIARAIAAILPPDHDPERAFFARGDTFPDALAVGPAAAGALAPVLLVRTASLPSTVAGAIRDLDIEVGYIAGDTSSVSAGVSDELAALLRANVGPASPIVRLAGPDRYATASAVVEHALFNRWVDLDTLGVATGLNFPDALGGGAALGYYGSPVILTRTDSIPPAVMTFLSGRQYQIGRLDVFGGTSAVSDGVKNTIADLIK